MFVHSVERKSSGSACHRVGDARENERRPINVRGCAEEPLATRGLQIAGRDAARTV